MEIAQDFEWPPGGTIGTYPVVAPANGRLAKSEASLSYPIYALLLVCMICSLLKSFSIFCYLITLWNGICSM